MAGLLERRWVREIWHAGWEVGRRWWNHDHSRSAAALAFFSLFSMVPMLVISTALASALIGGERARREVEQTADLFLDPDSSDYLVRLLNEQANPGVTGWASVVGLLVLVFMASKVMVELREVLGKVFGVRVRKGRRSKMIGLALGRVVPLLLILALGLVLAISAVLGAVLQMIASRMDRYIPSGLGFWAFVQQAVALVIVILLFTLILRWLPPKPPALRPAVAGALVACILLALLRGVVALYFEKAGVTSFYGAAVTLVVVLLSIYFTIQIFFIGAEAAAYLDRRRLNDGADAGEEAS